VQVPLVGTPLTTSPAGKQQSLATEEFLNLLAAQLKNQDPLNPTSDLDFMGQMAQFQTLQELSEIKQTLGDLSYDLGAWFEFQNAVNFLGQEVLTAEGSGLVEKVTWDTGQVRFLVNGKLLGLENILGVALKPAGGS